MSDLKTHTTEADDMRISPSRYLTEEKRQFNILLKGLTNINTDNISQIISQVDKSIKTIAFMRTRFVFTLLRTLSVLNLAFIDVITCQAIVTNTVARWTGTAE